MPARTILAAALGLSLLAGCAAQEPTSPSPRLTAPVHTPASGLPTTDPTALPTDAPTPGPTDEPTVTPDAPGDPPSIGFEEVAEGLGGLTFLTHAGDGTALLFAVEQRGVVRIVAPGREPDERPFLDISDRVSAGGERGLLGLAFHPAYADNGRFFVNYSARDGANVIAEFQASEDRPPELARDLLRIEQPFPNHNGGMLAFGADGMLYISSGDGGGAADPLEAGQDRATLLGKILRIDVDGPDGEPYGIPADNPFVGAADGSLPEIWSYGLRNPWRFSFDRHTGAMWIGDVGQNRWEEVNVEPAGEGGRNYGWNIMEGPECFEEADCETAGLTLPVAWYPTGADCAITGGYVYRGSAMPELDGFYLFADYCSGTVWALDAAGAQAATELPVEVHEMGNAGINVTGFGEDMRGELYLVGAGGEVLRVVAGD
jgi:glucose/arabinose dehydrogenase